MRVCYVQNLFWMLYEHAENEMLKKCCSTQRNGAEQSREEEACAVPERMTR